MQDEILCIGEVLWDALPGGLFLGGAPLNVACHLHETGRSAAMCSSVGDDALGREIVRRLKHRNMSTDLVQASPGLPTGFVTVGLDASGTPEFEIVAPSAWDTVECTDALLARAAKAKAVVYGSLAQRSETSRATIRQVVASETLRVFDVNLRPPFDTQSIVEDSLKQADVVKLNDDEMARLAEWFDLPPADGPDGLQRSAAALSERFECPVVCVTRGADGAALWLDWTWYEHPGFVVDVVDTVGSGDAFLAAFLDGTFAGKSPGETLVYANAVGAFVAACQGATPAHDFGAIVRISEGRLDRRTRERAF